MKANLILASLVGIFVVGIFGIGASFSQGDLDKMNYSEFLDFCNKYDPALSDSMSTQERMVSNLCDFRDRGFDEKQWNWLNGTKLDWKNFAQNKAEEYATNIPLYQEHGIKDSLVVKSVVSLRESFPPPMGATISFDYMSGSEIKQYKKEFMVGIPGLSERTDNILPQRTENFIGNDLIPPSILSPLKQFKSGTPIEQIQCKQGLMLVKKHDNSPACIKASSLSELNFRRVADCVWNCSMPIPVKHIHEDKTSDAIMVVDDRSFYYYTINGTLNSAQGEGKKVNFHNVTFTLFPRPPGLSLGGNCHDGTFGSSIQFSDGIRELLRIQTPQKECLDKLPKSEMTALTNHTNPQAGLTFIDGKTRLLVSADNVNVWEPKQSLAAKILDNLKSGPQPVTDEQSNFIKNIAFLNPAVQEFARGKTLDINCCTFVVNGSDPANPKLQMTFFDKQSKKQLEAIFDLNEVRVIKTEIHDSFYTGGPINIKDDIADLINKIPMDFSYAEAKNPLGIKAQIIMQQNHFISCPVKCVIPFTPHLVLTAEKGIQFIGYEVCSGSCKKDKILDGLYVSLENISENYTGASSMQISPIDLGNIGWQKGDTVHIKVMAFPATLLENNVIIRHTEHITMTDLGTSKIE